MARDKAYLVGTHRYSFKAGIPGEIIGVEMIKPDEKLEPRLCYHVQWSDMYEDWVAAEHGNYKIIGFKDILEGNIPQVTD